MPRRQFVQRGANLGECHPDPLCRPDHRHAAENVGKETALVTGDPLARQQTIVGIPAHRRRRDLHPVGDLAHFEARLVPVEIHELDVVALKVCIQVHLQA